MASYAIFIVIVGIEVMTCRMELLKKLKFGLGRCLAKFDMLNYLFNLANIPWPIIRECTSFIGSQSWTRVHGNRNLRQVGSDESAVMKCLLSLLDGTLTV